MFERSLVADCALCGRTIEGGSTEQGIAKRFVWRHVRPTDADRGGQHVAVPLTATIENVSAE